MGSRAVLCAYATTTLAARGESRHVLLAAGERPALAVTGVLVVAAGDEAARREAAVGAVDAGPQAGVLERERAGVGPGQGRRAAHEVTAVHAADLVGHWRGVAGRRHAAEARI